MAENKVYCTYLQRVMAPASLTVKNFSISNPGRKLKLKSVLLDWRCENVTTNQIIPFEQNTTNYVQLAIGVAGTKIASTFTDIGVPAWTSNGGQFIITRPEQYAFNSFYAANSIDFVLLMENRDAINQSQNYISIIVEIEERNIYQS
jgi:hypothetical protein